MKRILFLMTGLFILTAIYGQLRPKVSSGKIIRHQHFKSEFVDARNVDVWLPANYSPHNRYAVLYMHDGQMLYDSTTTWNNQEWGVDEAMSQLQIKGIIRDCIVVGIWNNGNKRFPEYFPQRAWVELPRNEKITIASKPCLNNDLHSNFSPLADNYLRFIVRELKPFIDSTYHTLPDQQNTFLMGSSMGGLISLYGLCEYPGIFGGAACLSTHWPALEGITLRYVKNHLPAPKSNKIYYDHGTETLDSLYEPFQQRIDSIMMKRGYQPGLNYLSEKFEGEAHTESAWKKRLPIPLEFLLKKTN
ncbi:MAG: alpha/beta hydrolase [Bacteroidales bacterium]|nr:alpha/beta hydrolase [Bacteroidales bacterium]